MTLANIFFPKTFNGDEQPYLGIWFSEEFLNGSGHKATLEELSRKKGWEINKERDGVWRIRIAIENGTVTGTEDKALEVARELKALLGTHVPVSRVPTMSFMRNFFA